MSEKDEYLKQLQDAIDDAIKRQEVELAQRLILQMQEVEHQDYIRNTRNTRNLYPWVDAKMWTYKWAHKQIDCKACKKPRGNSYMGAEKAPIAFCDEECLRKYVFGSLK